VRPTQIDRRLPGPLLTSVLALCCASQLACSPKRYALRQVADALTSGSGGAFARDDDPELVKDALPFALKTMESLADSLDDHVALRQAMAAGFTQYGYAFLQEEADEVEAKDPARAKALRVRARKLYLRARDYGLDGLRISRGITLDELRGDEAKRTAALERTGKDDAGLLYWTLVPWAAAIAADKRDLELVGDLPLLAAMLDRALALDESYQAGALHEFSLAFDGARAGGTSKERQQYHYKRALELAAGKKVSAKLSWAENVLIPAQDRKAFEALLNEVLAFDVDAPAVRDQRLANLIAQRRARFLLAHVDDFISD
jgi:predicted anti-sigma-YlaC factor YlaD